MYLLRSTFGHKLLPYMPHMEHISLQYMTTECHYQVVAIYRSDAARFGQPLLWPSACFPTPWANTDSVSKLIAFLVDKLQNRNNLVGFISQCVLTPTPWFIFKHLLSKYSRFSVRTIWSVTFQVAWKINVWFLWKRKSINGWKINDLDLVESTLSFLISWITTMVHSRRRWSG